MAREWRNIPTTIGGRILVVMEAGGITTGRLSQLTGYPSQRLANYFKKDRLLPGNAAIALGKALGFNTSWLYESKPSGISTARGLRQKVKELLDDGWKPHLTGKRGRPLKRKEEE